MKKSNGKSLGILKVQDVSLNLMKANDMVADIIRREMGKRGLLLINMVSSPGSGKTSLLEQTISHLKGKINIAVIEGDLETERDAERIRSQGVQAVQIVTGGTCHLEAQMIHQSLPQMELDMVDVLFIENVGNLVCPASYDLGEDFRVILISTTEGDDKPKKYPGMFLTADLLLVTKTDLLPYVPFSVEKIITEAGEINPDIQAITLSSLNGDGMDRWTSWLMKQMELKKGKIGISV